MRRVLLTLAVAATTLLAASSLAPARPAVTSAAAVPAFGHVFVIIGENKSPFQITSQDAPYMMDTLKPTSAWFTDYNSVVFGSLADYVALTSGQYDYCETQGPPCSQNVPSIFSQLGDGQWKDWNESMPVNCYRKYAGSTTTFNPYKPGHNPAIVYLGLPCSTYDVPAGTTGPNDMSTFNAALANGTVPTYNLISPNLCEDSYHQCDSTNIVTEYDNFLKREIPLIESSPAFGSNGVIFVTYDEGYRRTRDSNTVMIVTGPQVRAGIYTAYYNHYSTLATIQQGLRLPCLANTCSARAFPVFNTTTACPSTTGGKVQLSRNVSLENGRTGWYGVIGAHAAVARIKPGGGSYGGLWALRIGLKAGKTGPAGMYNARPVWVSGKTGHATMAGRAYTASVFLKASAPGESAKIRLKETTSNGTEVGERTNTVALADTWWHQITVTYHARRTGDMLRYGLIAQKLANSSQNLIADCLSLRLRG